MKKSIIYTFYSLAFLLFLTSCDSDEEVPAATTDNVNKVTNIAKQGTWKVTLYNDHGQDKTDDFEGYAFTFGDGNVLTAINGDKTKIGRWAVTTTDENGNSATEDNVFFYIEFPGSSSDNFEDITDHWDIITINDAIMELGDDIGMDNEDRLTFEKITD